MKYQYRKEVNMKAIKRLSKTLTAQGIGRAAAKSGAIAAVKGVKPTAKSVFKPSAARAAAGALKGAKPKGALKGEERKFYKMTGHTGMKMTKLPRRSK